jgi:hypothetical protein
MEDELLSSGNKKSAISQAWTRLSQIYQSTLDRWTPHSRCRWFGTLALLLGFGIRIVTKQVLMMLCCSSGTKGWWTGQYHGKKLDGSLPSCSS